ncbi:MAG TPA: hypothetical protein VFQ51_10120 [Vicinamibacteria bacterium]|nr:hypothetical protein [Vicinamibacteria bacterium]
MARLLLAAALSVVAGVASGQSLGEVARREQEKKEKKQSPASPAPTYTESDLKAKRTKSKGTVSELPATGGPPRSPGASPDPSASPGTSPSPDASPSPETEPDRAALEREWRIRFANARTRIAEAEARAYEERIEVVFVSGIPVQQRVRVKVDTKELLDARQALADLEEELRRSGGLPGWAR